MSTIDKTALCAISNRSTFKKKELKKKITDCLHICQCGRQFLSFPAVYSHAKTKHNFKISSRLGDEGRKIVEKQSQVLIYYQINNSGLLDQKSVEQQQLNKHSSHFKLKANSSKFNFINKIKKLETFENKKNIYAVMVEFLNESSHQYTLEAMNFTAETLDLLTTCINEHYMHFDPSRIYPDYCSEHTSESLPCYFNFFMVWYLPTKEKQIIQERAKVEALLKILFEWLRNNSYTNLQDKKQGEEESESFWKSFFIKSRDTEGTLKEQTPTKKQTLEQQEKELKEQF